MKVVVSGCPRSFSGLVTYHPKQPFGFRRCNGIKFNDDNVIKLSQRISGGSTQYFPAKPSSNKYVLSAGRNQYQWSYQDDLPPEPFVLTLVKEVAWGTKWLFSFLIEQPSQLKYLEWPSFQSTLKTATLTLVIVALLIVVLSSVDSVLCYLLALLLRRTA